jgi:hypothetical protein
MKRAKIKLPQQAWGSTVSKYGPDSSKVGVDSFTEGTKNIDTYLKGDIIKREAPIVYGTPTGPIKDQFEAVFSDGTHHMLVMGSGTLQYSSGSGTFSSVTSGYSAIGNMEFAAYSDRVYFGNSIDEPQVYDRTQIYGGVGAEVKATGFITFGVPVANDTVIVNGTTFTYVAAAPAANEFTNIAELEALVEAVAGLNSTENGTTVSITSTLVGVLGNAQTLALGGGNTGTMAISGATLTGGVDPVVVPKTKAMGLAVPSAAPTTALVVDSTANQVPAGAHTYKVTFLYYDFEESNGSPASTPAVTTDATHTSVALTAIPVGGYGVTARKIYRDDTDGVWRLVGTVDNNTATTFTDTASIGTVVIPMDNNPPRDFSLIVQHKDRMWMAGIAGDPSELDFSEASLPDIVLSTNTILCNPSDPITGLAVYNDRVVVFNRNSFGQIFGTTADTFRYSEVPGSIGCVDNRTIQVSTINGVPTLIWLSAKGFYRFNGSTVDYISDDIEDQVRFNLQQANQVKGSNSQSTQSDFQAGTSSTGIDTDILPGSLTTRGQLLNGVPTNNPLASLDTQAEWETFSAAGAVVTRLPSLQNKLASATQTDVKASTCTLSGLEGFSGLTDMQTIPAPDFTGETQAQTSVYSDQVTSETDTRTTEIAIKISVARPGTITEVKLDAEFRQVGASPFVRNCLVKLYSDALGIPGSVLASTPFNVTIPASPTGIFVPLQATSLPVAAAGNYWLSIAMDPAQITNQKFIKGVGIASASPAWSGSAVTYVRRNDFDVTSAWGRMEPIGSSSTLGSVSGNYTFVQTAIGTAGTLTSQIIDTGLFPQATSITVQTVGTSAMTWGGTGSKSGSVFIEQADSDDMLIGLVASAPVVDPTQTQSYVFTATKRYWRIKGTLQTTDDRYPAVMPWFYFTPPLTTTWESPAIDCSTDVTSYDAVVESKSIAAGGAATLTAATSDDDIVYSAYGAIGAAVVKRYIKLKYELATGTDGVTPSHVTSLTFSYKLAPVWESRAIDLGAAPEGWDVLQVSSDLNGGTLSYEMKSAATSGGLGAASYVAVTPGSFPNTVPLNRWVQYRISFASEANKVPVVQSVTTNWFIKLVNSVRAASLFYFRTYYVCLAEYNNTTNNLMLVLDPNGNWRIHRDLNAATFGFFFQDPYYGDAVDGKIKKLLGGINEVVKLDVRTKAFDFEDVTKAKILRQAYLVVGNTGATYRAFVSADQGQTFTPLVDAKGLTVWQVPDDGGTGITSKRLVPDWSTPTGFTGKTLMLKITEETEKQASIQEIHVDAYVRDRGELIDG